MTRYLPRLMLLVAASVAAMSMVPISADEVQHSRADHLSTSATSTPPDLTRRFEHTGGRLSVMKVSNLRTAAMAPDYRDDIRFGSNQFATYTWGYISGSVFYRRNVTRLLDGLMNGPYHDLKQTFAAAVAGIGCTLLATPLGGAICAGASAVAVAYLQDTLALARSQNACLRVRYFPPLFGAAGLILLSADNGRWCRS